MGPIGSQLAHGVRVKGRGRPEKPRAIASKTKNCGSPKKAGRGLPRSKPQKSTYLANALKPQTSPPNRRRTRRRDFLAFSQVRYCDISPDTTVKRGADAKKSSFLVPTLSVRGNEIAVSSEKCRFYGAHVATDADHIECMEANSAIPHTEGFA
jgi:hypothetical protein